MSILGGLKTLIVATVAFFAGAIGWAAVSGVIGGILDSVGIVIAGSSYVATSPVVGVLAAAYVVSEVQS